MAARQVSIKRKIMRAILLTSGLSLVLTCAIYIVYEYYTFRQNALNQLSILGKVIAENSTAALAFDSPDDAEDILSSLKVQPHITQASLYDMDGKLFAHYPDSLPEDAFPPKPLKGGYFVSGSDITGFQSIDQKDNHLGMLYLKSDMLALYDHVRLYALIALIIILISFLFAFLLSNRMEKGITAPILALAGTARNISDKRDYNVRAEKFSEDEIGLLTDAFNQMLNEIQAQNREIKEFNQNLEKRIRERTVQLEEANNELESFSYSVSHDLRAPLRAVDGYARMILRQYGENFDDEAMRLFAAITDNALKMGKLIDDLLSFSRIGKQEITRVSLNMQNLANAVVEELKSTYNGSVNIVIDKLPGVEGDSSMLKQVLANLVSNAVKYSQKTKKPKVEIGHYREGEKQVYFVRDNGAGFDMQYYDKLFGVFQRLHGSHEFEGTGVGLALVKRIIDKHGGDVWAEGKVDEGATFFFSLPIKNNNSIKNKSNTKT